MDRLQSMRVYAHVADAGSFTAAANSLGWSTGAVSRTIADLETHLRTRLINRTTRRLALTSAGERYLERCRSILAEVDHAEEEASCARERPAGIVKIQSVASVGHHYVMPAISKYRESHPDVDVHLTLSQEAPDLYEGRCDVAVVLATSLPDSGAVSQHLGSTFSVLCASPAYLRSQPSLQQPRDLSAHACVMLQSSVFPSGQWLLEGPDSTEVINVHGSVQTNIADSLAVAIRKGMGVGALPLHAAIEGLRDGSLVRVLPDHTLNTMNIYALYPSRRYVDAKIKTWVQCLRTHLPEAISQDAELLLELRQGGTSAYGRVLQAGQVA
jgi:DNA-binding transcriptional LysR family regulator